jgi:hypothetical protein
MLVLLSMLPRWTTAGARHCASLVLLLQICANGASATALYTGTVANDVQSASLGYSQITRAVAAAPDGKIYVGFLSTDGAQLRIARSSDRGATFSPSVIVDTAALGSTIVTASIGVSAAGTVLVAYADSSSNVFFARSTDAGLTFTPLSGLGTTQSTDSGVQVQSQGSYVYVGYIVSTGVNVVTSSDSGATFPSPPVTVTIAGGFFGLLVDQSNGDLVVGGENANLYVRVSHDHGATFDAVQTPSGLAYYSNWTISSDANGRFLWVDGANIGLGFGDPVFQIDLSSWNSQQRTAFLNTTTDRSRSMYAVACGDIVDSVAGSVAVSHSYGTVLGTTHLVGGINQTTSVNPLAGDVLVAYQNGTNTQLDVYQGELFGCGPHLDVTVSDGHDFARYGQTLNYLVTLFDANATAENVVVALSTPGNGLDLANAHWQCVGSDNTALCSSSNGTGASLGTVTLPAGTSMTWIVSVPVLATTTDDTIELDAGASGPTTASNSDTDTLVIFRGSFDVANGDGTSTPQ